MNSIWLKDSTLTAKPQLSENIRKDVIIIGGGMAGMLTAYLLQEQGLSCAVLERNRIGNGATAFTTAKITSGHGIFYNQLINDYGLERSRMYAVANQKAVNRYISLIEDKNIDCDLRVLPNYIYDFKETDTLLKEIKAMGILGLNVTFVKKTELPFVTAGALRQNNQAQFHPLKFLAAIANSVECYEKTTAVKIKGHTVHTIGANGEEHTAVGQHIVIATHYPFINVPGLYFMRLHQSMSYVVTLNEVPPLNGMYIQAGKTGYSLRSHDNTLLFGGFGHRTGNASSYRVYNELSFAAKQYFPQAKPELCWSNEDCVSLDQVPYIGRFRRFNSYTYVATGFKKWGMSSSMAAAMMLCDQIIGKTNEEAELFTPRRFKMKVMGKPLWSETKTSFKNLVIKKLPKIANSFKKLFAKKGRPAKDLTFVPPTCTHLGCTLTWNSNDQTWDCPCHGSRFTQEGEIINNPAKKCGAEYNSNAVRNSGNE